MNGKSIASRTVANHYVNLRNIPSRNVVVLHSVPDSDRISLESFREDILRPTLEQIQSRKLSPLVQGIAYSTDFPTSVDLQVDADRIPNRSPYLTPVASINGLTFLYQHVLADSPNYMAFDANSYASRPGSELLKPFLPNPKASETLARHVNESAWEDAAKFLESELKTAPRELRPPLFINAARMWTQADKKEDALRCLEQAVLGGWPFRSYLTDPAFKSFQDEQKMQRILKLCKNETFDYTPFRAFDARQTYAPNSIATHDSRWGTNYLLSMVLGVSRDLGISQFEVVEGLKRSSQADFRPTAGEFIFCSTDDVRTKTRSALFEPAIDRLTKKGFIAKAIRESLPSTTTRCAGLMMGTPQFSLSQTGVEIVPGAIAENLTSLGGAMRDPSQTKATELIRFGAACSSGAVFEPFTIPHKFPTPFLHDAYTDGMTSAEAYYSTILCPYQLLIIGDPICQPYAIPPRFELHDAPRHARPSGDLHLDFVQPQGATSIESMTVTMDGEPTPEFLFDGSLQMHLQEIPPGWHELRMIAKSQRPMQFCFEQSHWLFITQETSDSSADQDNTHRNSSLEPAWKCPEKLMLEKSRTLRWESAGLSESLETELWHEFEQIAILPAGTNEWVCDPSRTGYGPVRLQLKQKSDTKSSTTTIPQVVWINP